MIAIDFSLKYDRLFAAVPDSHNGITFCTGSLGAGRFNDLPKMAAKYAKRIYFAHLRQLKFVNDTDFYENGHQTAEGNVDIYPVCKQVDQSGMCRRVNAFFIGFILINGFNYRF